jgi:hypothetical protein
MVEMVHDRIAAGVTTVVSTAAVLRCGKQMEKLPHYNFSRTVSLQNWTKFGRGYGPVARQTNRRREENVLLDNFTGYYLERCVHLRPSLDRRLCRTSDVVLVAQPSHRIHFKCHRIRTYQADIAKSPKQELYNTRVSSHRCITYMHIEYIYKIDIKYSASLVVY